MRHVVALSGGKDSVAMALLLREQNPHTQYTYICNETGNELPEMRQHWQRLSELLQAEITPVTHSEGLAELCDTLQMLPSWRARWCTRILKIEPTIAYLESLPADSVLYVGLRADEEEREGMYGLDIQCKFPLREAGMNLADVQAFLRNRGVVIPKRTDCAWCPYQKLGEWKALYFQHPDLYWQGVALEFKHGHTFRSPGRDTWPAGLLGLSLEFERGRKIRGEEKEDEQRCNVCRK